MLLPAVSSSARRLESGVPANTTARARAKLSMLIGSSTRGSPSASRASLDDAASPETRSTAGCGFIAESNSRISRPISDSPPTIAMRGTFELSNLMLRPWSRRGPSETPADEAADANRDAASDICDRQDQQDGLGRNPDEINEGSDQDHSQRGSRP